MSPGGGGVPRPPLEASIRLAIFDLAGTTVDDRVDGVPVASVAMRSAFQRAGILLPPGAIRRHRGRQKSETVARLVNEHARPPLPDPDGFALELYAVFLDELRLALPKLREVPGAAAAFRHLCDARIVVAIESGFPTAIVEELLRGLGWREDGLVDLVLAEERGSPRPNPAPIHRAMRQLGVADPRKVVKIGDTDVDVEEGRNAGVWTVGVLTGAHSREELLAAGADRVVESVAEVPALLGARPSALGNG